MVLYPLVGVNRSEAGRLGYLKTQVALTEYTQRRHEELVRKFADKKCPRCGATIPFERRRNKFCSHSCAALTHNAHHPKRSPKRMPVCAQCAQPLVKGQFQFCSTDCHRAAKWEDIKKTIEATQRYSSTRVARRYLTETQGHKCAVCGICEWLGKPLVMILDHQNGNSEDMTVSNLRLLCPACDSQTPTWKGRNKGHGRHNRRLRYQQGKSY